MDSMRSLNRSLPSAASQGQNGPPDQLLQAFKQAALSVSTLYKSAFTNQESIRQAGYQDCIDDLLKLLDKENIGLQDGEGWRIRQWATARYDGCLTADEADDEAEVEGEAQHTSSPEPQPHRATTPKRDTAQDSTNQTQSQSQTPVTQQAQSQPQPIFHFASGPDTSMQTEEPESLMGQEQQLPPVRVEVHSRPSRSNHKQSNRQNNRPTTRMAGSKRKMPFPDLSEIFNLNFDKKDGFDGGSGAGGGGGGTASKRTRLT